MPRLFISYSNRDERWRQMFTDIMDPIVKRGIIEIWYDGLISSGGRFEDQILDALAASDAAILLVSPQFLSSKFISEKELPEILRRIENEAGFRIFPVLVNNCFWRYTDMATIQFCHDVATPLAYMAEHEVNHELIKIGEQIINHFTSSNERTK